MAKKLVVAVIQPRELARLESRVQQRMACQVVIDLSRAGVAPMLLAGAMQFQDATLDRLDWYENACELIARCDAVMVLPDWDKFTDSHQLRDFASDCGLRIFERIEDVKVWAEERAGVPV